METPSTAVSAHPILEAFFDLEGVLRRTFDTHDGIHHEGYALDVEEHRVLWADGGPLASDSEEWIAFDRIRIDSLWYWDKAETRWIQYTAASVVPST